MSDNHEDALAQEREMLEARLREIDAQIGRASQVAEEALPEERNIMKFARRGQRLFEIATPSLIRLYQRPDRTYYEKATRIRLSRQGNSIVRVNVFAEGEDHLELLINTDRRRILVNALQAMAELSVLKGWAAVTVYGNRIFKDQAVIACATVNIQVLNWPSGGGGGGRPAQINRPRPSGTGTGKRKIRN